MANPEGSLKPGRKKTGGRQKGVTNKVNRELKDMILGALSDVGGQSYLAARAIDCPGAFLTLVGKCLPKDPLPDQTVKLAEPIYIINASNTANSPSD